MHWFCSMIVCVLLFVDEVQIQKLFADVSDKMYMMEKFKEHVNNKNQSEKYTNCVMDNVKF